MQKPLITESGLAARRNRPTYLVKRDFYIEAIDLTIKDVPHIGTRRPDGLLEMEPDKVSGKTLNRVMRLIQEHINAESDLRELIYTDEPS